MIPYDNAMVINNIRKFLNWYDIICRGEKFTNWIAEKLESGNKTCGMMKAIKPDIQRLQYRKIIIR
jgi:hypothetical protein